MTSSAGDSRMSSMSRLYATPATRIFAPLTDLRFVFSASADLVHHVVRHAAVDVAGQLDEPRIEAALLRLPRQVERVDRNAVSAEAGARIERHESERLRPGRVHDLPDVDVHAVAHQRELVDEPDVHRAERVLQQLDHLGHAGRTHRARSSRWPMPYKRRGQLRALGRADRPPLSARCGSGTSGCRDRPVRARRRGRSRRPPRGPSPRAAAARLRRSCPDTSSIRARSACPGAGASRSPSTAETM